ncbi:glycosyltransferase family 2 protein [Haloplanus pelagicus]|uniref:glycosyltransferase family 2 protein n=1 Tax=Haloplanus pelagicus TaxID=2949995 RepID=UPI00203EC8B1|nr:glycosyltransferase family 2 protein [Haloplanus sp. HW8-1]
MNDETVSVVIPTYFRNERLREAIESVRAQTYEPIEIIVVDGSEEAHARPVAENYDVRYIPQDEDRGPHAGRSEGAQVAEGAYVNFLDDDDRFHPRKIEKQRSVLDANDEVGVVYCGIEWENGHPVLPDPDVRGDVLDRALMFDMTPSSPSTMLIDADVLDAILPFENLHGADDMGMKIELAQRCAFDFVDEPLVTKGDDGDGLGGSRENIEGRFTLVDRYRDLYDRHPPHVRRTAVGHTHLLDAELTLNRTVWSPRAIRQAALACYHVPGLPLSFAGYLVASVFGRPGRDVARGVYSALVLGDEHRGKIT